jgi:hypothetical protein
VVERRGRDLNLPTFGSGPILRDHRVEQLEFDHPQRQLVFFTVVALLRDQPANALVSIQVERVEPGQLAPDLQVAEVLAAESPGGGSGLLPCGDLRAALGQ